MSEDPRPRSPVALRLSLDRVALATSGPLTSRQPSPPPLHRPRSQPFRHCQSHDPHPPHLPPPCPLSSPPALTPRQHAAPPSLLPSSHLSPMMKTSTTTVKSSADRQSLHAFGSRSRMTKINRSPKTRLCRTFPPKLLLLSSTSTSMLAAWRMGRMRPVCWS